MSFELFDGTLLPDYSESPYYSDSPYYLYWEYKNCKRCGINYSVEFIEGKKEVLLTGYECPKCGVRNWTRYERGILIVEERNEIS
jgi:DNA-directed RNA polymerase subunit RPC12/RpoP